jgi:hypothetical protein
LRRSSVTVGFWSRIPGAPESFEGGLQIRAQSVAAGAREVLNGQLLEQARHRAVLFQHREPLGLGRVRRQHRLNLDLAQHAGHGVIAEASGAQPGQLRRPQTAFRRRAFGLLAQGSHPSRGAFLDHVEELERDRIDESKPGRQLRTVGERLAAPGNEAGQFLLADFLQHLGEAIDQQPQVATDVIEADPDVIRARLCEAAGRRVLHPAVFGATARKIRKLVAHENNACPPGVQLEGASQRDAATSLPGTCSACPARDSQRHGLARHGNGIIALGVRFDGRLHVPRNRLRHELEL